MMSNLVFDFLDEFVVVLPARLDHDLLGGRGDLSFVFQLELPNRNIFESGRTGV
jgi:hypothetical protein